MGAGAASRSARLVGGGGVDFGQSHRGFAYYFDQRSFSRMVGTKDIGSYSIEARPHIRGRLARLASDRGGRFKAFNQGGRGAGAKRFLALSHRAGLGLRPGSPLLRPGSLWARPRGGQY